MKNASVIINNIINVFPKNRRKLAREILECKFLAQMNNMEISKYLNIPYYIIVETLQQIKTITKGKTLSDFT